jgi:hypothetical protein
MTAIIGRLLLWKKEQLSKSKKKPTSNPTKRTWLPKSYAANAN